MKNQSNLNQNSKISPKSPQKPQKSKNPNFKQEPERGFLIQHIQIKKPRVDGPQISVNTHKQSKTSSYKSKIAANKVENHEIWVENPAEFRLFLGK